MTKAMNFKYVPAEIEDGELIGNEAYELEFMGLKIMVGTSVLDGKTLVYVDGDLSNARIEINEAEIEVPR